VFEDEDEDEDELASASASEVVVVVVVRLVVVVVEVVWTPPDVGLDVKYVGTAVSVVPLKGICRPCAAMIWRRVSGTPTPSMVMVHRMLAGSNIPCVKAVCVRPSSRDSSATTLISNVLYALVEDSSAL
jgi:hypothetical protein